MNAQPKQQLMLLDGMAAKYGLIPTEFSSTVRATCGMPNASPEEFAAFISVCREYGLNPITREIYAMPKKGGGLIPVVGIDGWIHLINDHPQADGFTFDVHEQNGELVAITCRMYRKDRSHPVEVTEYLSECVRVSEPWKMKHRMLRHKALIQAARYAFGFSGIYEEDEAERFAAMKDVTPPATPPKPPLKSLSQPIEASPMPTLGQRPTSSVQRMPPEVKATIEEKKDRITPPKPPKNIDVELHELDMVDADTGEIVTPGQMLSDMDDAMAHAATVDQIEEIWNEHDLEAKLQNVTKGEEFMGVAWGIKRRHLKRVTGAA
jgi:phage recombination protein Bet